MVFVKGYTQTKEQQSRMKKTRYGKYGSANCVVCGEKFKKYSKSQETCSKRSCRNRREYIKARNDNPTMFLAIKLFSTIRMGKGKKKKAYEMVKNALGKPCPYCKKKLTLYNISIDHKQPRTGSKVYDRRKKKMIYSKEEIKKLDRQENLHLTCRECNQRKGNFTHEQFTQLLDFLKNKDDLANKLFERLKLTRIFFGKRGYANKK